MAGTTFEQAEEALHLFRDLKYLREVLEAAESFYSTASIVVSSGSRDRSVFIDRETACRLIDERIIDNETKLLAMGFDPE